MELTRRHVLAGAAGIASAPLLPAISAQAAAPMADKQAPSFYRYKVGDIQVNAIFDGSLTFPLDDNFVAECEAGRRRGRARQGFFAARQNDALVHAAGDQYSAAKWSCSIPAWAVLRMPRARA